MSIQGVASTALLILFTAVATAQETQPVQRVTNKDGKLFVEQGGESVPMTQNVVLPYEITVTTNSVFIVNGGKPRTLHRGESLSRDGMLTNPDGTIVPVIDHLTKQAGKVLVVKDGESQTLQKAMVLPSGTRVQPDGTMYVKGQLQRLVDGQYLRLDGSVFPAKDTVTLKNGRVLVQKDGAQFPIQPRQTIMMNDGTRVFGNGTVQRPDGQKLTLTEGQILTLEGVSKTR